MEWIGLSFILLILAILISVLCHTDIDINWHEINRIGEEQMRNAGYSEEEIKEVTNTLC